MRPPICCICGKRSQNVKLIYFKKRKSDIKWEKRMKRLKSVEHTPYAEWFCADHYVAANELKHLPINIALKQLKSG